MSNDVKRKQSLVIAFVRESPAPAVGPVRAAPTAARSSDVAKSWLAMGAVLAVLFGLIAALPAPTAILSLTGTGTRGLDAAMLAGASLLVWGLTAWVLTVALVAAVGVLPGACGRAARAVLRVIAPRIALRLVAATIGASALASTTACAAPIFADPLPATSAATTPAESGAIAAALSAATSDPSSTEPPATGASNPDVHIPLDWPTTSPTVPSTSSSSTPAPTTPEIRIPLDWPTASPPADGVVLDIEWPASDTAATAPADPSATTAAAPTPVGAPSMSTSATASAGTVVTVRPGDTLWSLAQRSLPGDADDAAVDAAWRQWYAANRDAIGADPDRLEPGQTLTVPTATPPFTDERNSR